MWAGRVYEYLYFNQKEKSFANGRDIRNYSKTEHFWTDLTDIKAKKWPKFTF